MNNVEMYVRIGSYMLKRVEEMEAVSAHLGIYENIAAQDAFRDFKASIANLREIAERMMFNESTDTE